MIGMLEEKRAEIAELCTRFGASRLDVFGSALRDDFEPEGSDLDFLVEFGPLSPYERADAYFGLLDELRTLLGVDVDLVVTGAVKNRFIAADIERTKRVYYAA